MPRIRDLGINHIPMSMQGGGRDWPGPCGEGSPTSIPRPPGQPPGPCGEGSPTNRPDVIECNPDSPSCEPHRSKPPSPPGQKKDAAGFPLEAIAQLRQQLDHRLGV